ncbi:MAG: hypothetical protein WBO24_15535, partial [Nitrospirales bacterium]
MVFFLLHSRLTSQSVAWVEVHLASRRSSFHSIAETNPPVVSATDRLHQPNGPPFEADHALLSYVECWLSSQTIPENDPAQQTPGAAQDGPGQHISGIMRAHVHAGDAHEQRRGVQQARGPKAGMEVPDQQRRHKKDLAGMPTGK